ncbi:hypothetical protein [Actinomadura rudentiformis]|uniref:Uncharacterized protein n=1 Tax=Actinomadura rudentiformis TaxID=359158 RepID=A0A6H9YS05_9ACTN|nr:hypothetical protein [Actinomadura rudentiformis]KAB2350756.1 hypothetical protein F8566_07170 [Actinomadura rudentiformis]
MRSYRKALGGGAIKVAMVGVAVAGSMVALTSPASASHKCGDPAFDYEEVCYYRHKDYSGGSRAFTGEDKNYTNDYYDYASGTVALNNTISSYNNRHWAPYHAHRYVGQEGPLYYIKAESWDSDLASSDWWGSETGDVNDKLSSHTGPYTG